MFIEVMRPVEIVRVDEVVRVLEQLAIALFAAAQLLRRRACAR